MSIDQYRRSIRSAARGLWSGAFDYDVFVDAMWSAIDLGLRRAWNEGAAECGIAPDEMTFKEQMALRSAIIEQRLWVDGLATFIEQNSKAMDGKWSAVENRVEIWVNRYNAVANQAKTTTCADQKLRWTLNALRVSQKHCSSCLRLAGKVKRASQWDVSGWQPQGSMLECGGWRCACALEPTDEPMSKGPLPRAP